MSGAQGGLPAERRTPHPDRLPPSHPRYRAILAAHEQALVAGEAMYPDPSSGLFVLTAARLWERGECCGSGCRHCPWHGREHPEG